MSGCAIAGAVRSPATEVDSPHLPFWWSDAIHRRDPGLAMPDKYASFAQLSHSERAGKNWTIRVVERPGSAGLILAPHGGRIENGTSELATLIAGGNYSVFCFEGLKSSGNRDLHITSSQFDHPACAALLAQSATALAIHGCTGRRHIYVGGLDAPLVSLLTEGLLNAGFPASAEGHSYPGRHPRNICNRTTRACGAQLELTLDLRAPHVLAALAAVVRPALAEHLRAL